MSKFSRKRLRTAKADSSISYREEAPTPVQTATIQSLTSDGRRMVNKVVVLSKTPIEESIEDTRKPEPHTLSETYEDNIFGDIPPDLDITESVERVKARRYMTSDDQLNHWRDEIAAEFLDEILLLEGRGFSRETCSLCGEGLAHFRCKDCLTSSMWCQRCTVNVHALLPLHNIEWNDTYFVPTSLQTLGLRVQLGHQHGKRCSAPHKASKNFNVIHVNGVHRVSVDFCECGNEGQAGLPWQQLLRVRWFPASHLEPQTAFTFAVLETFHIQTLQAKINGFDFYRSLEKLTDNCGLERLMDRYKQFMMSVRKWRALKMLKRGGRGHDDGRIDGTKPGGLAVLCPACPRPDENLPEGWEKAPPASRFLYTIFLAMDACFRLKRRMVGSASRDPGLLTGLAYFVFDKPFEEFIKTIGDQEETSTCRGLAAIDYANTKFSRGYSSTGVGINLCARHEIVLPHGLADLQKGEKYANMDYVYASACQFIDGALSRTVSYDIACQWSKKFFTRIANLPLHIRQPSVTYIIRFVIPKLHIEGHGPNCIACFSLNFLVGAGMTDGEGVERPWAAMGPLAMSTRLMGPGARHDTLDDHWGFWNWRKIVGLGVLLLKRLERARDQLELHHEAYTAFCEGFPTLYPEWELMVLDYEADDSKPNPYQYANPGITETGIRMKLAMEDAADAEKGLPSLHSMTASTFVSTGLQLEEQQRRLRADVLAKKFNTVKQKTTLIETRTRLSRQIVKWRSVQATYMPAASQALANRPISSSPENIEDIPLFLPSGLPSHLREHGCLEDVLSKEIQLREAQCHSALQSLRNQLLVRSQFIRYKGDNIRAQKPNTRARNLLSRNEEKIRQHAEKYRVARDAIISGVGSSSGWAELKADDVRGLDASKGDVIQSEQQQPGKSTARVSSGQSTRQVSWIWLSAGPQTDETSNEALRVEWCKGRARRNRWEEEIALVKEEMRRVPISLRARAAEWLSRIGKRTKVSSELEDGLRGYSCRQASIYQRLAERFEAMWSREIPQKNFLLPHISSKDDDAEDEEDMTMVDEDTWQENDDDLVTANLWEIDEEEDTIM